jgi:hypothetical protein
VNGEATADLNAANVAPPPTYAQLWRATQKATVRIRRVCVPCACYNIGALLDGSTSPTYSCIMSHTLAAGDNLYTHCATSNVQCFVVGHLIAILLIVVEGSSHSSPPLFICDKNICF